MSARNLPRACVAIGTGVLAAALLAAGPAEQPKPSDGRLDERHVGELLWNELRCGACHADENEGPLARPPAPDLSDVANRVAPEYLVEFLTNPTGAHAETQMPDLLRGMTDDWRSYNAVRLTHDLLAQSPDHVETDGGLHGFGPGRTDLEQVEVGRDLYHSIGCVACHEPFDEPRVGDEKAKPLETWKVDELLSLRHLKRKWAVGALAEFLMHPLEVRPGGRMPDLGLNEREAEAIASYLLAGRASDFEFREMSSTDLAGEGEKIYAELGCASCHESTGYESPAPAREELDPDGGCMNTAATGSPGYVLTDDDRVALKRALAEPVLEWSAADTLDATLSVMRCDACHQRGEHGGVPEELNAYFQTSEPDLGDEARIPPPLTDAGTKLQEDWIGQVLFDGASIRPYMHTRMPQFGLQNLDGLPELFAKLDEPIPYTTHVFEGEDERRAARDAGRRLLGIRGGACVSCHDFNGRPSPSFRGLDLIGSTDRLRPGWFREFCINPQKLRPGIVMPESWSGGEAAHPDLEGDTDAQIQAIWDYLTLGRSAGDPDGISRKRSELFVEDEVRTYRGRSRIAGFRGIAVGYPGGLNYAFDANNGSLAGIWSGNFVTTYWESQGAGDFNPAGRPVELARDVALYALESEDEPWPLRPFMDDDNPINPDPTYPRNRGYRWRGYAFGENRVPTLRYESGGVAIEDTSAALMDGEHPVLRRTLRFSVPAAQTLWFRVLTGSIEELSPTSFEVEKLRLRVPAVRTLRRSIGTQAEPADELLLELLLPAGTSEVTVDYELR